MDISTGDIQNSIKIVKLYKKEFSKIESSFFINTYY